jgi:hypothetical protein
MKTVYEITFGLLYICFKVIKSYFWEIIAGLILVAGGIFWIGLIGGR